MLGRLRPMLGAAALPLLLGGCGAGCEDEVLQHEPSPYGGGTAIVFVRNCGATTAPATQVAIVGRGDDQPRGRSVVFVADGDHGAVEAGPGPRVRVRWMDGDRLEVAYDASARTSRRETEHGRLRILYTTLAVAAAITIDLPRACASPASGSRPWC